ncbi:MAG: hypothetical protein HY554_06505 [Elusimicrobia bacterium]|nr:hypothetical protein [Elusimicrobiota bacterium]
MGRDLLQGLLTRLRAAAERAAGSKAAALAGAAACLALLALGSIPRRGSSASLAVDAYYPAPVAAYHQLVSNSSTTLARDRGDVDLGIPRSGGAADGQTVRLKGLETFVTAGTGGAVTRFHWAHPEAGGAFTLGDANRVPYLSLGAGSGVLEGDLWVEALGNHPAWPRRSAGRRVSEFGTGACRDTPLSALLLTPLKCDPDEFAIGAGMGIKLGVKWFCPCLCRTVCAPVIGCFEVCLIPRFGVPYILPGIHLRCQGFFPAKGASPRKDCGGG